MKKVGTRKSKRPPADGPPRAAPVLPARPRVPPNRRAVPPRGSGR